MRTVISVLAVFALLSGVLAADNWVYLVEYSAEGCALDKWTTYSTTKISGGCSLYSSIGGARYIKYDCSTLTGLLCTDDKCTTGCNSIGALDYSARKDCTRGSQTSPRWYRAFCGDVSSPYGAAPQVQLRYYTSGNLSCSTPMTSATGFPSEQCVASAGNWAKYSCKDNSVTYATQCDSTCANCGSSITQTITQCILGAAMGCGVGSASTVVISLSAIFFAFAMLFLM